MVMREFKRYDHGSLDFIMASRHLHTIDSMRIHTFLSTRLQNVVPRLVAPAAMPPTLEMPSANPPLQAGSTTYSEEEEEMSRVPFDFPSQRAPGPMASLHLMGPNVAATPNEKEFPCEHCGKTFMSPYAVNGHKTHSKECSAKGWGSGPRA